MVTKKSNNSKRTEKFPLEEGLEKSIIASSLHVIIATDRDRNIVEFNKAAEKTLGYRRSEVIGKNVSFIYADHSQFDMVGEEMNLNGYFTGEIQNIRKDGTVFTSFLTASRMTDRDGRPVGSVGVSLDLSVQYDAQTALKNKIEQFEKLQHIGQIGTWEFDVEKRIHIWSDETFELYERDPASGTPTLEEEASYYPAYQHEKIKEYAARAIKTGESFQFDAEVCLPGGKKAYYYYTMEPVKNENGVVTALSGTVQDITDRKEAELELRASEERYRDLIEDAPVAITIATESGRVITLNKAFTKMTGYESAEDFNSQPLDRRLVDLNDREKFVSLISTQGNLTDFEIQLITKSGSPIWVLLSSIPLNIEAVERHYMSVMTDITEKKHVEELLRKEGEMRNSLLDGLPIAALTLKKKTREIVTLNATAEKMGARIGQTCFRTCAGSEAPCTFCLAPELWETGDQQQIEAYYNGRWYEGYWAPLDDEHYIHYINDITEAKEAEERVRESKELMDAVFNNSVDAVIVLDAKNFKIEKANDIFIRESGFANEAEAIGKTCYATTHNREEPCKGPDDECPAIATLKSGQPASAEHKHVLANGREKYLEVKTSPLFDGEGNLVRIVHSSRDITERVKAAEVVKKSEQNFRTSFDLSPIATFINKGRGEIIYANQAMLSLCGYKTFRQFRNSNITDRHTPDYVERIHGRWGRWEQGEKVANYLGEVTQITRPDGQIKNVIVYSIPIKWDDDEVNQVIFYDVTDRMNAEEALRKSENNFRNSLDAMGLGCRIYDAQGNIIYANKALAQLYGYDTPEEINALTKEQTLTPKSLAESEGRRQSAIEDGKGLTGKYELEIICKNGETRFLEANPSVIFWDGKKRTQVVYQDITDRKRLESERDEMRQRALVASRLAATGEMAAGIAHEINNPLVGVIGYSEMLKGKDLPLDIREELEMIYEGGQRVASIVKRLLAFARQSKPEKQSVRIEEVLDNTLKMRAAQMKVNNIELKTKYAPDLPEMVVDAGQMQQVFLNIILNAEKAIARSGKDGKLTVSTETIEQGNKVRISFSDTGTGIPKDKLEKIFDPFFTTSEVGQGSGLGLSICYGIISEHNGTIYAKNNRGKGATFIIELPVVHQNRQLGFEETDTVPDSPKTGTNVMLVDDDPMVQNYFTDVMSAAGLPIEVVENGAEALDRIMGADPDVIILDIRMPGKSGIEIFRELKKVSEPLTKRVIFVTGDVMEKQTLDFLKKSRVPYLTKPFSLQHVLKEIKNISG